MLYTIDSKTLLGFSGFIPANIAADWTRSTGEDWGSGGAVVVMVLCVCGGGGGGVKPFQN